MLKNKSVLECIIDNKLYQFMCETESPLPHVKEALFQFSKHVGEIEDALRKQQEAQSKEPEENLDSEVNEEITA